jgi:8-amino-7-oxononanoate synthase
MTGAEQFIHSKLAQRTVAGSLRTLQHIDAPIDFSSNDYLGFAQSDQLKGAAAEILNSLRVSANGATGSRLLTGNHAFIEETEGFIAAFHGAQAGLIFNSGYDANVGMLSSLPQRGDTIICDELVHASIKDGSRLSNANRYAFRHNDLNHLEAKLKISTGNIFVVVESVYSMDGDLAPLTEISALCETHGAALIVDEAHATGIFGDHGKGLVSQFNLESKVFARIITFGKALGCHGAIVLGSNGLRDYLINFARSFIYSTAAPIHSIATVRAAYQLLATRDYTTAIKEKIGIFRSHMSGQAHLYPTTASAIQTIPAASNMDARRAAQDLQNKGFDIRAILSPTVPQRKERLRICLHTYNTETEITRLVSELSKLNK